MHIIREVFHLHGTNKSTCTLRTEAYSSNFAHIVRLVTEARKDFPKLNDAEIDVVKFGGERYRKTMGIEFIIDRARVPSTYKVIPRLEFLL